MTLTMESYQIRGIPEEGFESLVASEDDSNIEMIFSRKEKHGPIEKWHLVYKDSAGFTMHRVWLRKGDFLCHASAQPPRNPDDSAAYNAIACSFINSFDIDDVAPYWSGRMAERSWEVKVNAVVKGGPAANERHPCWVYTDRKRHGMFAEPVRLDNGSLLVVYDIVRDSSDARQSHILIVDGTIFSFQPDSAEQTYIIPSHLLDPTPKWVTFGYTRKADTVHRCWPYFYESISVAAALNPE